MRKLTIIYTTAVITAVVLFGILNVDLIAGEQDSKIHTVEIRQFQFSPKELEVSPGDKIVWVNFDLVPHTVTANDESWDSQLINSNAKWEMVVQEETFTDYYCRFHTTMKGQLKIDKK